MSSKKGHKIFFVQLVIGVVILFASIYGVNMMFHKAPNSEDYLTATNEITNLRKSSSEVVNTLISEDELTFDPTNGISIEKVFKNLKASSKRKILLLGSSQLVTVSGDKSFDTSYKRRTDRLLQELYNDEVIVYNLSLGGMTVAEKEIVLSKIQELYNFDAIVVSIGPYDCREDNIRQSIQDLKNKQFEPRVATKENDSESKVDLVTEFSIQNFNNSIEENISTLLEENSSFYKNKTAIKSWIAGETGTIFTEKPVVKGSEEPSGWKTFNQSLTIKSGWVNTDSKPNSKALKIVNTEGINANWKGVKVNLKKPTKTIIFSGSGKSENAKGAKLFCLDFKVEFTDGTYVWYYKGLAFKQGTNDWKTVTKEVTFEKEVASITPTLLFYRGTGTVWFDNIEAKPVYNGVVENNIIINPTIEEEKVIKDVYTLKFEEKVWNNIFKNAQNMTFYLGKNTKKGTKKYLLIPPVYNSVQKNGYQQNLLTDQYLANLKKACAENGVQLLDASKLLNENYFTEFESGERKGKVEPLHFNGKGHRKLAVYLYEKLKSK